MKSSYLSVFVPEYEWHVSQSHYILCTVPDRFLFTFQQKLTKSEKGKGIVVIDTFHVFWKSTLWPVLLFGV